MIRSIDFLLSLVGLILLFPLSLLLIVAGYLDTGSPLFFQERIGRNGKVFMLMKFRSMKVNAPSVASHMLSQNMITSYGKFIRRTKVDEIPQLFNVLVGDMSLVGARPCLLNQHELVELRRINGILKHRPGITGLAQVRNIDMSNPSQLVETEKLMYSNFSLGTYFSIIINTLLGKGRGDAVSQ